MAAVAAATMAQAMKPNDIIHNFTVDSVTELPEVPGRLWRMTYEKNGERYNTVFYNNGSVCKYAAKIRYKNIQLVRQHGVYLQIASVKIREYVYLLVTSYPVPHRQGKLGS